MQDRDYSHEYQIRKDKARLISVSVSNQVYEDFIAKCEKNGITRNALLKRWIEKYTYKQQ